MFFVIRSANCLWFCMWLNAAVVGVLMHEMPTVKASCQFLVRLMDIFKSFVNKF